MHNLQHKLNRAILPISITILVGAFSVMAESGSSAKTNIIQSDRNISLLKLQSQTESEASSTVRQVNDRNQLAAKQTIGLINRSQVVFRVEKSVFAQNFQQLAIELSQESPNYRYSIGSSNPSKFAQSFGAAKTKGLKNYLGLVFASRNKIGQDVMTTKICVSIKPNSRVIPNSSAPKIKDGELFCPKGYQSAADN